MINRCTLGLFLAKFCGDYLYYMFLTWVPSYLVMERGFSIIKMGFYASLPFLTAFLVQPLVGMLSDWLIKRGSSVTLARKGVLIGAQLCASTIMVVGFVDDPMIDRHCHPHAQRGGRIDDRRHDVHAGDGGFPAGNDGHGDRRHEHRGRDLRHRRPDIDRLHRQDLAGSFQLALGVSGGLLVLAALTVLFIIPAIKPMELGNPAK